MAKKNLGQTKPTTAKTQPSNTKQGEHPVKSESGLQNIQRRPNKPPNA